MKHLLLLLLLVSCTESPTLTRRRGIAMTIPYEVIVAHPDQGSLDELIAATFSEIDQRYNNWNPQSEISHFNQTGIASAKLGAFLARVDELTVMTGGLFDPAFTPGEVDLCGVAKGYCVDLLTERLINAGYPNCYVCWGGEIRTAGDHPGDGSGRRPWRISIQSPTGGEPIAILNLCDQAVATSGDYIQQSHIVDPRTGEPARAKLTSTTVVAPTCMEADALATALMVAGAEAEQLAAQLRERGFKCWLVVAD